VIGIDTNVLVRYLTNDEPSMADRAERLLERECNPEHVGFINIIVLCEVAWVLRRHYRFGREQVTAAVEAVLRAPLLAVEHAEVAQRALEDYRAGRTDFTDVLIGAINRQAGCETTATFDRRAGELESFRLL
jgi:predicted nucleic-acid-binding protein